MSIQGDRWRFRHKHFSKKGYYKDEARDMSNTGLMYKINRWSEKDAQWFGTRPNVRMNRRAVYQEALDRGLIDEAPRCPSV